MAKARFGAESLISSGLDRLITEIDADHTESIPSGEDFTEKVLKDEKGKHVINHTIHKEFHWFIQEAIEAGHNRIMILGAFQLGKCFVQNEPIDIVVKKNPGTLWSSSYRQIEHVYVEDVKAGDLIPTFNKGASSWVKLEKDSFPSGVQHCFEVVFHSGKVQNVSHNHPFLVYGNKWKKAIDLEEGDYVKLCGYGSVDAPVSANHDEAWYIGLRLGDGSYNKISCNDDLVLKSLEKLGSVSYCGQYDYTLLGSGKILRKFDIHDRVPKTFPPCVFSFDKETLSHFLAGYFDADGSVYSAKGKSSVIELYSVKKLWLDTIQNLLFKFGIFSTVRKKIGKYKGEEHISWRLAVWRKHDLARFRKFIPLRSAKKEKLDQLDCEKKIDDGKDWNEKDWLYDVVREVNYIGKRMTYGIEVPKTHVHVVNGLVSHNTDQIAIGYVLEMIAKDLNIRVKVVCNTDDFGTDRVRAIRRYIDADDDFKELCPHVKPTRIWGDSKFIVHRKAASKDATIESFGLFGTAVGSRAELIVFDDPQDWRTAVTEPTTRERCKSVIENVWLPRLTEDGVAILLMNRWHELDVPGWIKEKKEWAWMEAAISEDYRKIEITRKIKGEEEKFSIPSWKGGAFYARLRADMGERNFVRSCRLIPFSDSELYFPSFEKCCVWEHDPIGFGRNFVKKKKCLVVTGIDYSTAKRPGTILFTIGMDVRTQQRVPLDLVALKDPAKLPEHLVRLWMEYGVDLFYAENNATQAVINDLLLSFAGYGRLPIEGFYTGKNKADPDMGIISLEKEFDTKMWQFAFPSKPEAGEDRDNVWSRMYFEVRDYPFWEPNDIAMSLWFAREGLNYLIRKKPRPVIY